MPATRWTASHIPDTRIEEITAILLFLDNQLKSSAVIIKLLYNYLRAIETINLAAKSLAVKIVNRDFQDMNRITAIAAFVGLASTCGTWNSVNAQTIIVDNSDPQFSVLSETWSTANVSGQYGADYRYRSTSQAEGEVEWRPDFLESGEYQVDVWYRSTGLSRPDNAQYSVHHSGGITDVFINQQINGSQWVPLGWFDFDAGTVGSVSLSSAAQPGKTIVADAVRFQPTFGVPVVDELRACWLTHYYYLGRSESELRSIAQNMRSGGINTVYIAAYSGASVYWPSKVYFNAGGSWAGGSTDYMALLTDIFHEEGLKVGAWFEYGMAVGPASHPIAVAHPDWLARDDNGSAVTGENGGFVFLSPGHPDAMQLLEDMVRELAENYSFDDIQIDRYRWGRRDLGQGREYGYEAVTSALYQAQYGTSPPTNINNATWVAFREELVNDAVERCYDAIKAANPRIVVSSAPTGSYGITQHMQRWSDWVEGGYMDLVMPQMYMTTLSAFQNEFNIQKSQAPAHVDKLAVGYRAQEDNSAGLVADQMNYAIGQNVSHGCLWVYHQYSAQVAIQDELNTLPQSGQPWEAPAANPFVDDRMLQLVIDDADGSPSYQESGSWISSAQADYLRFGSRVAEGPAIHAADYSTDIPKAGRYDVYVWYTASGNRNAAAKYTVHHFNGSTDVYVDQRSSGGQWVPIGRWIFDESGNDVRVTVSTEGSLAGEYTSADGVKLVLEGYALGDSDGDGDVDLDDYEVAAGCLPGPDGGPIPVSCEAFDVDDDGDSDLADWAMLQTRFGS